MKSENIIIKLKSFTNGLLDKSVKEIINAAKRTGAVIVGPIYLPTKINRTIVKRSPHIDKESMEHFEMRTHKRVIYIKEPTPQTIEALMKLELSVGLDVEIKL